MFGLNGIGGMLIATALLLSILGFLGYNALIVQQNEASHFYTIDNPKEIKMNDTANAAKAFVDAPAAEAK